MQRWEAESGYCTPRGSDDDVLEQGAEGLLYPRDILNEKSTNIDTSMPWPPSQMMERKY